MIIIIFICLGLILYSDQPVLMFFSLSSLYFSYFLFWKPYEPKVIFFGVLLSWLTITIKIFYAFIFGLRYENLSISTNIINTTYVSLIGFCIFCLGLWFAIKDFKLSNNKMKDLFNEPVDFKRILKVYALVAILSISLKSFIFYLPGFSILKVRCAYHSFHLNGFFETVEAV